MGIAFDPAVVTTLPSKTFSTSLERVKGFFFSWYADHRDLHNSPHSFPTRRSSDLNMASPRFRRSRRRSGRKPRSFTAPSAPRRSEEHTSELQSRTVISYAVFCLKKKKEPAIAVNTNQS